MTALDDLADAFVDDYAALDPVTATYIGVTGFDDRLTDYSPAGHTARADLVRAVLAALERKDAERLARLQSGHEVAMLELAEVVRREQAEEAYAEVDALLASRNAAASRYSHYQYLLTGARREPPEAGSAVVEEPSHLQFAPSSVLAADERGLGLLMSERDQLGWLAAAGTYALFAGISNAVAAVFFAVGSSPTTS